MAKKQKKELKNLDVLDDQKKSNDDNKKESEKKPSRINEGKCCRCIHRDREKICQCTTSKKYKSYVARKGSCKCFKYND